MIGVNTEGAYKYGLIQKKKNTLALRQLVSTYGLYSLNLLQFCISLLTVKFNPDGFIFICACSVGICKGI